MTTLSGVADAELRLRRYCGVGCPAAPVFWLESLALWGGIDVATGTIVDPLHPRRGLCLHRAICLVGATKGSTAGPGALIEWICGRRPPAALLTRGPNLGVAVAAQALALTGSAPTVLGEIVDPPALALLASWDGVTATLENDLVTRVA